MLAAILNIIGGLGLFAFLLIMLLRGRWARQGWNRALPAAVLLASIATVLLASSMEQYGLRARNLKLVAGVAYAMSVLAVVLWWRLSRQRPPA